MRLAFFISWLACSVGLGAGISIPASAPQEGAASRLVTVAVDPKITATAVKWEVWNLNKNEPLECQPINISTMVFAGEAGGYCVRAEVTSGQTAKVYIASVFLKAGGPPSPTPTPTPPPEPKPEPRPEPKPEPKPSPDPAPKPAPTFPNEKLGMSTKTYNNAIKVPAASRGKAADLAEVYEFVAAGVRGDGGGSRSFSNMSQAQEALRKGQLEILGSDGQVAKDWEAFYRPQIKEMEAVPASFPDGLIVLLEEVAVGLRAAAASKSEIAEAVPAN